MSLGQIITSGKGAYRSVTINITEILIKSVIEDRNFDHRYWSLWDAEIFELAAQKIRDGYAGRSSAEIKDA